MMITAAVTIVATKTMTMPLATAGADSLWKIYKSTVGKSFRNVFLTHTHRQTHTL